MDENPAYVCPRCGIGNCQPTQVTYTRMHKGHLISVPNMTRYTCDVCAYWELDQSALSRLVFMLGHSLPMKPEKRQLSLKKSLETSVEPPDSGNTPRPKR